MAGSRSALIIATQTYDDAGLTRLQAPDADAQALAEVLADPAIGDFDVTTVVDGRAHEVNRAVAAFFHDRRADDLLLLHFSCHGLKDDSGELYFAATDTDLELLDATAVPSSFVNRVMDRSRAGRVLLLLDCCYAGAFARGMTARAAGAVDVNERLGGRGRAVITASSALQFAFEGQALADVASAAPSVFTSALVRGLRTGEADRNLDGWVSLDELYAYVHDEVTRDNPDQTPKKWAFDIEGDVYVARRGQPVSTPSELPAEILRTLGSLLTWERASAVQPLQELLAGEHPGLALGARRALERLAADDDSARVRSAASTALASGPAAPAGPSAVAVDTEPDVVVVRPRTEPPPQVQVEPPRVEPAAVRKVQVEPAQVEETRFEPPPGVEAPAPEGPPPVTPWHRRPLGLAALGGTALLLVVVALVWRLWPDSGPDSGSDSSTGGTASGGSSPLPDSTILLSQRHDGPSQLVSYDVAGDSGDTVPVIDSEQATLPTISPDRRQVLYMHGTPGQGRTPHLADVDGSHDRPLLSGASATTCPTSGRPAWSPDSGTIALICGGVDGAADRLYTVRPDGSDLTLVIRAVRPAGSPTWADDHHVIYESTGAGPDDPNTLAEISADNSDASVPLTTGARGSDTQPDAVDGGVVFLRTASSTAGSGDIWFRADDGQEDRETTDGLATWPAASPDGTSVVWLQRSSATSTTTSLWIGSKDGTGHRLKAVGQLGPPAWGSR